MKDHIRIFGKKILRTSLIYKTIRYIGCIGPYISPLISPKSFEINTVEVPVKDLPLQLEGLKILHLSDIHAGMYVREEYLNRMVEISNRLDADLVVITGDFTETDPDHISWSSDILNKIKSKLGIFGVLGNHDIWNGAEHITEVLNKKNIKILRNQNEILTFNGAKICLAGIDDYKFGTPDIVQALRDTNNTNTLILLSHTPDAVESLNGYKVDLMLSGHIHGGQWNLPILGVLYIPSQFGSKHAWGLSRSNNTWVYTSKGIGVTTIPLRVNCPPEITTLILKRAE